MSNEYVYTVYMLIVFGCNACITIAIITNNTCVISLFFNISLRELLFSNFP